MDNTVQVGFVTTFLILLFFGVESDSILLDVFVNIFLVFPTVYLALFFYRKGELWTSKSIFYIFYVSLCYIALLFLFKQYKGGDILVLSVISLMISVLIGTLITPKIKRPFVVRIYLYFQVVLFIYLWFDV